MGSKEPDVLHQPKTQQEKKRGMREIFKELKHSWRQSKELTFTEPDFHRFLKIHKIPVGSS